MVSKRRFGGTQYLLRNMQRPVVVVAVWKKWHRIPKGRDLSVDEQTYILNVLKGWLLEELHRYEINR